MNDNHRDALFLRDLANRLMHIPVMFNVDQGDVERLEEVARRLVPKKTLPDLPKVNDDKLGVEFSVDRSIRGSEGGVLTRLHWCLSHQGITRWGQLNDWTPKRLMTIPNFGRKSYLALVGLINDVNESN